MLFGSQAWWKEHASGLRRTGKRKVRQVASLGLPASLPAGQGCLESPRVTSALGDQVQSRSFGCIPPPSPSLGTWFWSPELPGVVSNTPGRKTPPGARLPRMRLSEFTGETAHLLPGSPLKSCLLLERQPGFRGSPGPGSTGLWAERLPTPALASPPQEATSSEWGSLGAAGVGLFHHRKFPATLQLGHGCSANWWSLSNRVISYDTSANTCKWHS